jgi:type III restriction enzyme
MATLQSDLEKVNTFRNTRVAHVDTKLDNAEEAWEAMRIWFRCLSMMIQIAS